MNEVHNRVNQLKTALRDQVKKKKKILFRAGAAEDCTQRSTLEEDASLV